MPHRVRKLGDRLIQDGDVVGGGVTGLYDLRAPRLRGVDDVR